MDVYVILNHVSLGELRARVPRLEDLGVRGVLLTDHLFFSNGRPNAEANRRWEPLTLLAVIASLSDRLRVGTIVSNIGLLHPALVLRQFAQLASLVGGERVLAGLGAGWNREEFEALGMTMPGHRIRMDRLEESAALARQLFDHGIATLEGSQVQARELPLTPLPEVPPRLLLGGGSDRLMEIAGRYADMVDLNGSSRSTPVKGADLTTADTRRELSTTVEHLEGSVERVRAAMHAAARPADAVVFSHMLNYVTFCRESEVVDASHVFTRAADMGDGSIADCPYALVGEPARMREAMRERRDRLGVSAVLVGQNQDWPTVERLCLDVLAHID
jgi:alkanesulfonate monooxygenase SsuD/methylene tetrahydromethanopterin reductase-like flavin-dependent oxidoreductase (luciferase family)